MDFPIGVRGLACNLDPLFAEGHAEDGGAAPDDDGVLVVPLGLELHWEDDDDRVAGAPFTLDEVVCAGLDAVELLARNGDARVFGPRRDAQVKRESERRLRIDFQLNRVAEWLVGVGDDRDELAAGDASVHP